MSNDETQPVSPQPVHPASSGSRWEQGADQPTPLASPPPAALPPAPAAYAPAPTPRPRGRALLAGGAVGIALVAGTGGFALGHATGDDGRDDRGMFGRPGDFPGGPQQNFPGDGPRGAFPGQGQPGIPGQPPGGFPDRRDDNGYGDQQQPDDNQDLPDDGATSGSSTT